MKDLKQAVLNMLGLPLSAAQLEAFVTYSSELIDWNRRFNLTAISAPEEVMSKHFLDSLSCWLALRNTPVERVIDVGSGAGFPGLPLKILQPELQLTLVESVGKKTAFLEHMVQVLGLEDVQVLNLRAEEVGQMAAHRESYDWALARALASLPILAEYLLPLVKVGGRMLAQKGRANHNEVEKAKKAIGLLGGGSVEIREVNIPDLDEERHLIIIEKVTPTEKRYPRRSGIPAKRPL